MLRFLLRRIPRFGFVTLFAAMLLFVSVAGWAKWHLDLWREEEALLADLAKAGVRVMYRRDSGDVRDVRATSPTPSTAWEAAWSATAPFFSRIVRIDFFDPAPRELLDRAAQLPFVALLDARDNPAGTASPESIAAKAGFILEPLTALPIPANVAPLPQAKPVEDSEARRAIERFVEAWDSREPPPSKATAHIVVAAFSETRGFFARDGSTAFKALEGRFELDRPVSSDAFVSTPDGFEQVFRWNDPERAQERFLDPTAPVLFDPQEHLQFNLEHRLIDAKFHAALRTPEGMRVGQIDERTYRFDLPPLSVEGFDGDVYTISLIVRADLDWTMEAWDVRGSRTEGATPPPNVPQIDNEACRGELRREGAWVVAEKWTLGRLFGSAGPTVPDAIAALIPVNYVGVARYDFTSDLDLSHVTPEVFDAKMLPPQRKLPWLRWHRVTFAMALCLFAFGATRKLAGFRGRAVPDDGEGSFGEGTRRRNDRFGDV